MWAYMTTGTTGFLEKLSMKHNKSFFLMRDASKGLLYYEDTKKKSVFVSGIKAEVPLSLGEFDKKGFVKIYHIPVKDEEQAFFVNQIKKRLNKIFGYPGLQAVRLLDEAKTNKFIIILQWAKEEDHDYWQKENKQEDIDFTNMAALPAYFADRPFTNTYYMVKDQD